jgi:DNA-binding transcriptional ArsR family regulator
MEAIDRPDQNDLLIALRHPLRRLILREMADGKVISPLELSNTMRQPLSNVSYHVRVLAKCAAVTLVDTQPTRGSVQHFYRSAVTASWAQQVLGSKESEGDGAGENSSGTST